MNIGDVITTAEQLEAVPPGAMLQGRDHDELPWTTTAGGTRWDLIEYAAPLTVIYLPGQLPRPERVVKAEALREYAVEVLRQDSTARGTAYRMRLRADAIERGEV